MEALEGGTRASVGRAKLSRMVIEPKNKLNYIHSYCYHFYLEYVLN
jgi:hypothetical protein